MINFIKNLLGLNKPTETVREILTPQIDETKVSTYIEPAKPNTVAKVRAITDTNPGAVAAAHAQKSANKKRRPYRGNKGAGGTVAKINQAKPAVTEGKAKGGNGAVKPAQVAKAKPVAPKAPTAKK